MAGEATGGDLIHVVALLGAGVVAVPLFKRLGLGSVIGYLAAGLAIGPFGLKLFSDPLAILHLAEFGVVMFLFVIGLEMQPSRLWGLRREIFGLGALQVAGCGALLTVVGVAAGYPPVVAFIAAMGFVLTSTATVMQLLTERGETSSPAGQRIVSVLLLEDLAIAPLLAIVSVLAPSGEGPAGGDRLTDVAIAFGALAGLIGVGLVLLNPVFRLLASAQVREIMTAAALLVVLGSALIMQLGGLTMAMGAFIAGVLLSESSFRHQLEADIEPFRGLLLGLFFMAVGMSLDLTVMAQDWALILGATVIYMIVKGVGVYAIARLFGARRRESVFRAVLMAQGGEFAFVLYSAAAGASLLDARLTAVLTATVIVSMALTPLAMIVLKRMTPRTAQSLDGVEAAEDLQGSVLLIGFGRFGQIVSQPLLARGIDITIIDSDTQMIRDAAEFGFKVYYGDGARLDVLHAAGARRARAVLVCLDKPETATHVVTLLKHEFPLTPVFARARDREHALALVQAGADFQIRETLESAFAFGEAALAELGVEPDEAAEIVRDVKERDRERFEIQIGAGIGAGRDLVRTNLAANKPVIAATKGEQVLPDEPQSIQTNREKSGAP